MAGLALRTRYAILGRSGGFIALTVPGASALLRRTESAGSLRERFPSTHQWEPGGVLLFGATIIRAAGKPVLIDRAHLSLHAIDVRRVGVAAQRVWPWCEFGAHLMAGLGVAYDNETLLRLGDFLAASADRPLPSDVVQLLHETPAEVERMWLQVLVSGRYSHPLWDIQLGTPIAAGTAIVGDVPGIRHKTATKRQRLRKTQEG